MVTGRALLTHGMAGALLAVASIGAPAEAADKSATPTSPTASIALSCDPHRAQVDQAQALLNKKQYAGATTILNQVLAEDKTNIVASFLLGTIKIRQNDAATKQQGFDQIQMAASAIPSRPVACAQALGWYAIYLSLGVQYYNRGDKDNSAKYLQMAYAHRAFLKANEQKILYDDLGRLSLSQGNFKQARIYYTQAKQAGSKSAVSALSLLDRLESAGHS